MKNLKKILFTFGLLIILFLLASCENDKVESFKVKFRSGVQQEIYEGEDIDLDWFELVVNYTNGKSKVFQNHEYYLIKNNLSTNNLFDHKDDSVDKITFDLVFEYDKFKSNKVPITVKKDKVQEVSILNYGKAEYLYGEEFDVSNYKLFVKYFSKPNELVDLTIEMLDLDSKYVLPEELGIYSLNVWYNGVKANSPLSIVVTKNYQTLEEKVVKALYLGDSSIQMSEIPGAVYKFYPKGANSEDYNWSENHFFENNLPIIEDYVVLVKYPENNYFEESNVVKVELDYLNIQLKPLYITKTETSISFKKTDGYDVVMIDHRNLDITEDVNEDSEYITFIKLLPNHDYRFALRLHGSNTIYETQILAEPIKTRAANSPIIYKQNQTQTYSGSKIDYLYTIKPTYQELDGAEFNVDYYQDGILVNNPTNVGLYDVVITTNLNDLEVLGSLTITPKTLYASINPSTKVYGDNDPVFDFTIDEISKSFLIADFTRAVGEDVGNYQVTGTITSSNPNYNVVVRSAYLKITKKVVELTINDSDGTYGLADSQFTYSLSDESFGSELNIILSRNSGLNVGNYQIKLSSYNSKNITLTTTKNGLYEIKPHLLNVTANKIVSVYGEPISKTDYEVNLSDLQYADTISVVSGELDFLNFNGDVDTYTIGVGSLKANSNYQLVYHSNTLEVVPKEITLLYSGVFNYEYGHNQLANITANANVALLAGEVINLSNLDAKAAGTHITEAFIKDQDNRDITFNYSITNKTTSFVITKKELVVTVNDTSRLYGTDNNTVVFTASVTGFVPGENVNDLGFENNLKLTYETTATIESTKGSYLVWINDGFTSSNYSFKYVSGILEVLARPFDIYADNLVVTYNNENVSYGLLENNVYIKDFNTGELIEGLTLNVSYKQNNISVTPKEVGEYVVFISFAGNDEYEETQKEVALTINKKAVTAIYNMPTDLVYNGTDQEVLVSFAGLVDSFEPLVLNNVNRDAGNYTITVNGGNNYNITNHTHNYVIAKKTLTVTQLGSYTYNGYSQTISLDVTGKVSDNLVIGDINLKDARSNEAYTLVYSGSDQANYILPETVLITIAKANLTITPNANQSKVYDGLAESNLTYTTNILGTDTISLVLEVTSKAAGIHPIVIKDGSLNYNSTNYNNPSLDIETFEISQKDITSLTQKGVATYNMETQNIYFDLVGLISGDDFEIYVSEKKAGSHNSSTFTKNGADIDNYNIIPASVNFTINKAIATLTGNEAPVNGYAVYGKDYTNNAITVFNDLNKFKLTLNGVEIDEAYTLNYSESELDLSNGGTTFVVDVSITFNSGNFEQIPNTKVVYKFKSVTIGTNYTQLYTIEDALNQASSGTIVVRYYTSFASSDVHDLLEYSNAYRTVKSEVTLLVPFDSTYNNSLTVTAGDKVVYEVVDPDNYFSKLAIPSSNLSNSFELTNNGIIIVNAVRSSSVTEGSTGATQNGFVSGSKYGILEIGENSLITNNGKMHSIGFIIGKGEIVVNSGAEVTELLFIRSYRGGSQTSAMYKEVFPFTQFTAANIEVKTKFNFGSFYTVSTTAYMSNSYNVQGTLKILDNNVGLIRLEANSSITKTFNPQNAVMKISIEGNAKIDNVETTIIVNVSTNPDGKPIDIPFDGTWEFEIKQNAKLTINSHIAFLPGASLIMEENSELVVSETGSLSVLNDQIVWSSGETYPRNTSAFYRTKPTFDFSSTSPIKLDLNGSVTVKKGGQISGNLESELLLEYGAITNYQYKYVKGFSGSSIFTSASYDTFDVGLDITDLNMNKFDNNASISKVTDGLNDYILLSVKIEDYYGNLKANQSVTFIRNEFVVFEAITDEFGIAEFEFLYDNNWPENFEIEFDIIINYENLTYETKYTFVNKEIMISISEKDFNFISNESNSFNVELEAFNNFAGLFISGVNITIVNSNNWVTAVGNSFTTNADGKAIIPFTITENTKTSKRTAKVKLNIEYLSYFEEIEITIEQAGAPSSSPFLYSEDEDGDIHFEHEPISFSMLKSVEGTTFGTLRLIQDQDGVYYIQIIEEGDSITALNSAKLYAIDYLSNQGVIDAMFDVYGNPHTIKERISPIEFMDQNGVSYLSQVLHNDDNYAAIGETEDLLSYFIATFDNSNLSNQAKLMITPREVGNTLGVLMPILATINGVDNLWWIDQAFINDPLAHASIQNVINSLLKMKIQVWDGYDWVTQGEIDPKTYLNEEMMVYLDLSNIHETELKVRLLFAGGLNYHIDSIYIDFSEDVDMIYHELNLSSAILNGSTDILDKMLNNADYIYLSYKEGVRLGFDSPELLEGYERTIGVSMKGYIYAAGAHVDDELLDESIGLSFEELKDLILSSERPELVEFVDAVEELYYTLVYVGTLDYEEIIYYMFEILAEIEEMFYEGLE